MWGKCKKKTLSSQRRKAQNSAFSGMEDEKVFSVRQNASQPIDSNQGQEGPNIGYRLTPQTSQGQARSWTIEEHSKTEVFWEYGKERLKSYSTPTWTDTSEDCKSSPFLASAVWCDQLFRYNRMTIVLVWYPILNQVHRHLHAKKGCAWAHLLISARVVINSYPTNINIRSLPPQTSGRNSCSENA
jgi:hypothetical protein